MKLSGLYSATVAAGSSIRFGGEEGRGEEEDHEDQREEALDDRGAAGPQRDRGADARRRRSPRGVDQDRSSAAPRGRPPRSGRRRSARWRGTRPPANAPSAAVPASRPSTIEKREIGAARRRSVKPISMSTASAIPPLFPASRVDWIIAPASMKSRKLSTCGEAGQVDRAAGAAGLDRQQQGGEDDDRRHQLRAPEGLPDRARAERADHPQVERRGRWVTAGLLGRPRPRVLRGSSRRRPRGGSPVLATKTSSRLGSTRSSDSTASPASSSARTTGATSAAPRSSSTRTLAVLARQRLAEARPRPRSACSIAAVGQRQLQVRAGRSRPSAPPACPRRRCCRRR